MKKTNLLKSMLLLCALIVGSGSLWAATSTLTFTSACGGSGTANDGAEWTVTSDGTESNFDGTSGIHYGTSSASVTYLQLSTSDISGTITQVVVNCRDAQATATVSVTVGETAFTCSGSATATNSSSNYTFTGSASGSVVVRIDRGSSMTKAIYVKSIAVTHVAASHTASFSINGVVDDGDNVDVEEGSAITFPSDPSDINGKTFVGWKKGSGIDGVTNVAPTLYDTDNMGNADVTYYAVFATKSTGGADTYEKLATNSFDTEATYVIGATQLSTDDTMWYFYNYSGTDSNISWGEMTSSPATNTPVYFKLSGSANSLVAKDNSNNYLAGLTTGKFKMSTTSVNIAIDSDGKIKNSSEGSYYLKHNYNGGSGGLRWYSTSTGTQAYFYKVIPGTIYSAYCTTVIAEPSTPSGDVDVEVTLTTTANMAGWRSYNNNTANKYTVDGTTKVYYASATGDNKVTLTEIDGGVPANTIVILHQTSGTTITLTKDDDATCVAPGSNLLKVSTENEDLGKVYRLGYKSSDGVGFYTYNSASAPAGIIYVSSISPANFLSLDFGEGEGDVTSISGIEKMRDGENETFFNLAGQRVAQPTKGLYIVNGKKVVLK